ncbi:hypothetical protein [Novosphingobium sediminicola]|uniref:VanZ-like domain-containing protein n=1 Tax=Novosphingobium sediminicola TaxID=563162 RepID=A0A7W6CME1_9SPHN|nr:hypothetical protein [Novosphingobium sediminicola]MBB3957083.1 hypothetical protein [Novosphingobium sediminicola]
MNFPQSYEETIGWIVSLCPEPDKFAHTYAGITIWLLSASLTRKSLKSWLPVLVTALFEGANEYVDRVANGSWRWHDTLGDVAATLFWPFVITFLLRRSLIKTSG